MAKNNRKHIEKALKKLHTGYIITIAVCLLIGAIAGAFYAHTVTANDRFTLKGEKSTTVTVGETLIYEDEGIECISMGKDVSDKVEIQTNMKRSEDGKTFSGNTDTECEYYITYTVTEGRYAGLSRIRIFTVSQNTEVNE